MNSAQQASSLLTAGLVLIYGILTLSVELHITIHEAVSLTLIPFLVYSLLCTLVGAVKGYQLITPKPKEGRFFEVR
jgi:biotin transporter BioY